LLVELLLLLLLLLLISSLAIDRWECTLEKKNTNLIFNSHKTQNIATNYCQRCTEFYEILSVKIEYIHLKFRKAMQKVFNITFQNKCYGHYHH